MNNSLKFCDSYHFRKRRLHPFTLPIATRLQEHPKPGADCDTTRLFANVVHRKFVFISVVKSKTYTLQSRYMFLLYKSSDYKTNYQETRMKDVVFIFLELRKRRTPVQLVIYHEFDPDDTVEINDDHSEGKITMHLATV